MKKKDIFIQKIVRTPDERYFQVIESEGVIVTFRRERRKKNISITIWGDDDIGMCKTFDDFDEGRRVYDSIVDGITKRQLIQFGFEHV